MVNVWLPGEILETDSDRNSLVLQTKSNRKTEFFSSFYFCPKEPQPMEHIHFLSVTLILTETWNWVLIHTRVTQTVFFLTHNEVDMLRKMLTINLYTHPPSTVQDVWAPVKSSLFCEDSSDTDVILLAFSGQPQGLLWAGSAKKHLTYEASRRHLSRFA